MPIDEHAQALQDIVRRVLQETAGLAADPTDEHHGDTPRRYIDMLRELTTAHTFKFTTFPNEGLDEMITQGNIPFVSLCEHHVLPFIGEAFIGYVPGDRLAGLSKLARTVKQYAAALQTQERLTAQVAERIDGELSPRGVAVVIRARHLCMEIRGVSASGALTTTASMLGVFADHDRTAKAEFMHWVTNGSH